MNIEQKLTSLKLYDKTFFPRDQQSALTSLTSQKLMRRGLFFSMKRIDDKIEVIRIKDGDKVKHTDTLKSMVANEYLLENSDSYRSIHVIVKRLNKSGIGEWSIEKYKDLVTVKRLK